MDAADGNASIDALERAMREEGRGAFGGFIGPRTLVAQVAVAAPYLFDGSHPRRAERPRPDVAPPARLHPLAHHPLGFWAVLERPDLVTPTPAPSSAARTDYFALCLAAHFASAATYVPTDVDAKIRHALWFEQEDRDERAAMYALAARLADWDLRGFSARLLVRDGRVEDAPPAALVSGHDGERLSVLAGAMLSAEAFDEADRAAEFEDAIDAELRREAAYFLAIAATPGRELDALAAAAVLTHNAGDLNQALFSSSAKRVGEARKERFGMLSQERPRRYDGAFARAAPLYRDVMAKEGHRNYPLRRPRVLRSHPDLLLPIGPFLEDWGERVASWEPFELGDRAEIAAALADGCRRVPGQEGYTRALAAFDRVVRGGLYGREFQRELAPAARRILREPGLRRAIAVPRVSFESSLQKRARLLLDRA